jgi:hypothetical protein
MLGNFINQAGQNLNGNNSQSQYWDFQRNLATYNLQVGIQQALSTANQVKTQAAQAGLDAAQSTLMNMLVSQDTINSQVDNIRSARIIQEFNNQISDRNKNLALQAATELQKSMVYNVGQATKNIAKDVGTIQQSAVERGTLASEGRSADITAARLDEGKKDVGSLTMNSLGGIKQAYENALSLTINKAMDNWNVETQIDFSNKILKSSLSF